MEHEITMKQKKLVGNYTAVVKLVTIHNGKRIATEIPLKSRGLKFTEEELAFLQTEWENDEGLTALEVSLTERF